MGSTQMQSMMKEKDLDICQLNLKNETLETKLAQVENDLTNFVQQADALAKDQEAKESEISSLISNLTEKQRQYELLQADKSKIEQKLRENEQEFQDAKIKYSDLEQRNKELEGKVFDKVDNEQYEELNSKMNVLVTDKTEALQRISNLETEIKTKEEQFLNLNSELNQANVKLANHVEELEKLSHEKEKLSLDHEKI